MPRGAWVLVLLAILWPGRVAAAEGSRVPSEGPRPSWVIPAEEGTPADRSDFPGGVEYLVVDDQVRVTGDGAEHWARRVRRVASVQGVDSESQFPLDWDPNYESLTIHRIVVRRAGREIDRLDLRSIDVVRREPAFEASLLDGTLSALIVVPDVRVGDVVEHEYSIRGRNPVFAGHWFGGFGVQWQASIRRVAFVLRWPKARSMHWQNESLEGEPRLSIEGEERVARWTFDDPEIIDYEGDAPPWFDPAGGVSISEFSSWADVARWAVPLYEAPPPDAALGELVARIAASGGDEEARVLEAVRFVQDDVRYLGLEIGAGSHRPSPPAVVLDRRFGDCKDKTLLLVTLLRALGVRADPALVSTTWGEELQERLPSPDAFDHVIVRLEVSGRASWIDPTISAQRGNLGTRHVPRLGKALLVRPGTDGLVGIEPAPGDRPRTDVEARFVLPEIGGPASMTVRTTYTGRDADDVRASLAQESRDQTERSYRDYYARIYPGLEPARSLVIRDDEDADVIVTEEAYRLPEMWILSDDGLTWSAELRVPEIENLLVEPEIAERESPLAIDHPQHVHHRCTVELPDEWDVEEIDVELESPAAQFRRSLSAEGTTLTLTTEWESQIDWIPAGEAPRHVDMVREAFDLTRFELTATAAGRPVAAISPADPRALNWSVLALAFVTTLSCAGAALALLLRRAAGPPPAEPAAPTTPATPAAPASPDAPASMTRFGGALVIIGMICAMLPIGLGASLVSSLPPYRLETWTALTVPGGATYDPRAAPLLLASLVGAIAVFVFSIALVPLLAMRRRSFRPAFVAVVLSAVLLSAGRMVAERSIPGAFPSAPPAWMLAALAATGTATVLYVLFSARARSALTS